jgi:hypothetical protein
LLSIAVLPADGPQVGADDRVLGQAEVREALEVDAVGVTQHCHERAHRAHAHRSVAPPRPTDARLDERELRRAQTYAIGLHAIRQQSGAAVLADAVDEYLFGSLGELEEYEARIRAVTRAEMQSVAHEHFDPARRVEGIVRGTGKRV